MTYPISDHFDGKIFRNEAEIEKRGFRDILRWWLEGGRKDWPKQVVNDFTPALPLSVSKDELFVSFIGHASFLLQFNDMNIITDPVFSNRASPFSWIGPKRVRPPALSVDRLPPIHTVLVSHNHYDHLDIVSLKELEKLFHPQFIVPLGDAKLLRAHGIRDVVEMDWWQELPLKSHGSLCMVPAQHWSARWIHDCSRSLWGGYVLSVNEWKVLFHGDTGYNAFFKRMRERLGAVDLSILPIGAYEPRWFMKDVHMNPEDAVQAHLDLGSRQSLASHYGTFQLTNESIQDPVDALALSLKKHKLPSAVFQALSVGETVSFRKNREDAI